MAGKKHLSERPACVDARSELGHWEMDTVMGKGSRHCILSLVERAICYSDRFTLTRRLDKYFRWFNQGRPHQSLDGQTPDEVYFANSNTFKQAA